MPRTTRPGHRNAGTHVESVGTDGTQLEHHVVLHRNGYLRPVDTNPIPTLPDRRPPEQDGPCESCGIPHARWWGTAEGRARLCPTCATLHGLGCP